MKIVVLVKLVPDLVDELEITPEGNALDTTYMRLIPNEFDDHAIEQAILIKEAVGGEVTVVCPDMDGADDLLFTSAAKGADHLIKLTNGFSQHLNSHALVRAFKQVVDSLSPDIILTGVQSYDSYDGSVGPLLAAASEMPYAGYISDVKVENGECRARKEYPGGLTAELKVKLPAIFGIQASGQPPRYVAISKVRQAMKSTEIESRQVSSPDESGGPQVEKMYMPESAERAEMLAGDEEQVSERIVQILKERGLV
ncbi:MAG: electron transfer flavoprotein subunit beta/FixA family protein [Anaerolineales bacterium]